MVKSVIPKSRKYVGPEHGPDYDLLDSGLGKLQAGNVVPRDGGALNIPTALQKKSKNVFKEQNRDVSINKTWSMISFVMSSIIFGSMFLYLSKRKQFPCLESDKFVNLKIR